MSVSEKEREKLGLVLKTALKVGGKRYRLRLQIIWFSFEGWSAKRIAQYFGVSERSVWKWRKVYREKGLNGLRGKYFSHRL
jgi:transposase